MQRGRGISKTIEALCGPVALGATRKQSWELLQVPD